MNGIGFKTENGGQKNVYRSALLLGAETGYTSHLYNCHSEGIFLCTRQYLQRVKRFLLNDMRGGKV
jgi:hypothetical protein